MGSRLGDMHHAAIALEELGGAASPREVAERLRGFWSDEPFADATPDVRRTETALRAAEEHCLILERHRG